jgi:hypothetical protein
MTPVRVTPHAARAEGALVGPPMVLASANFGGLPSPHTLPSTISLLREGACAGSGASTLYSACPALCGMGHPPSTSDNAALLAMGLNFSAMARGVR